MRRPIGWIRGAFASAALALAGVVAAWAATPGGQDWVADPDEQFILDVNVRQLMLGDGVRAYSTPEGTCVVFGDLLTALDVPLKLDLQTGQADGWAFREDNHITIDRRAGTARFGKLQESIPTGAIRETPEGWCVNTDSLSRWFGIGVKPSLAGSILRLDSETKLPVELAVERQKRAALLAKRASQPVEDLPKMKLPYRMWRTPMVDVIVSAGATYNAKDGTEIRRSASLYAAGEVAKMSYIASLSTDGKGRPSNLRFNAYRSDPDGGLLGPLDATHFAVGDVQGVVSPLLPAALGRGVEITNRPVVNPVAFDRTRFEGDLPPGWDAEIYRNGLLLAFSAADGSGRYHFEDVELGYGENRFEIILYGPQGQTRSRYETINIADTQVPKGKTWYAASISQPGKSLLSWRYKDDSANSSQQLPDTFGFPKLQAVASVEHGLTKGTSAGVLAAMLLVDDQKLSFVEGSVRQIVGPVMMEGAVARDSDGGTAARLQLLGQIGRVNISAEAIAANNFPVEEWRERRYREARASIDAPFNIGRQPFAVHGDVRYRERSATKEMTTNARISTNFNGFNLTGTGGWTHQFDIPGRPSVPDQFDLGLIASGRIKKVRLRGEADFEVSPEKRLRYAMLSAYWSASDNADWETGIGYDGRQSRAIARVSHIRRFKAVALAASIEAGSDKSLAAGINLNFSLDPTPRGVRFTNQRIAGNGTVEARVFRDLNSNGRRDSDEPFEKDVIITTGQRTSDRATDDHGTVRVHGLAPNRPVAVGIDASSLSDLSLAPKNAVQLIVPRAGIAAQVDIALVGAGDIEAVIVKQDGRGYEGLDVELVDQTGKAVTVARSDYDGFLLFERVPFGRYTLRIASASAAAAKLSVGLDASIVIDPDHTVVRLGTLRTNRVDTIASVGSAATSLR
nr:hypothetical protein [uncultured Sphingomonas sp.]